MEQYIKKSALVAEIERKISEYENCGTDDTAINAKIVALQSILIYIYTVERKEIDLEKELNDWRHNHFHGRRDKHASGEWLKRISQLELAKHFFELGMQAQKG